MSGLNGAKNIYSNEMMDILTIFEKIKIHRSLIMQITRLNREFTIQINDIC
jgi:hypothetical protein